MMSWVYGVVHLRICTCAGKHVCMYAALGLPLFCVGRLEQNEVVVAAAFHRRVPFTPSRTCTVRNTWSKKYTTAASARGEKTLRAQKPLQQLGQASLALAPVAHVDDDDDDYSLQFRFWKFPFNSEASVSVQRLGVGKSPRENGPRRVGRCINFKTLANRQCPSAPVK